MWLATRNCFVRASPVTRQAGSSFDTRLLNTLASSTRLGERIALVLLSSTASVRSLGYAVPTDGSGRWRMLSRR